MPLKQLKIKRNKKCCSHSLCSQRATKVIKCYLSFKEFCNLTPPFFQWVFLFLLMFMQSLSATPATIFQSETLVTCQTQIHLCGKPACILSPVIIWASLLESKTLHTFTSAQTITLYIVSCSCCWLWSYCWVFYINLFKSTRV